MVQTFLAFSDFFFLIDFKGLYKEMISFSINQLFLFTGTQEKLIMQYLLIINVLRSNSLVPFKAALRKYSKVARDS